MAANMLFGSKTLNFYNGEREKLMLEPEYSDRTAQFKVRYLTIVSPM
jgi:hypothetical protein